MENVYSVVQEVKNQDITISDGFPLALCAYNEGVKNSRFKDIQVMLKLSIKA